MKNKSVMVIAGEVSGDMHAAGLVRAILEKEPEVRFFGIGGDELRKAGMEILYDSRDMAALGLTDVLIKIRFFRKVFCEMLALARLRKPDAVLLVDYPGFNMRFARKARAMGLKVIYYICPQVWAWNRARIPAMARTVDRLIAIFPFEKDVFRDSGLKVDVVRHPLANSASAELAAQDEPLEWRGEPHIALLPGSRVQEVKRMLPVMWKAARLLERKFPDAGFMIAAPNEEMAALAQTILERQPEGPAAWTLVGGQTRRVLRQARAAMVASGTATVEAALMRCPMVVIYKTAWATYLLGRLLVKLPFLSMVNIIAGRRLCPELIQHGAVPSRLAAALSPLIADGDGRNVMLRGFEEITRALSGGGEEAADIVLNELNPIIARTKPKV